MGGGGEEDQICCKGDVIEEGSGVTLLLAVFLILWIARSGLGGCLAAGVLGSGGEEETRGLSSLRGTFVVATTW